MNARAPLVVRHRVCRLGKPLLDVENLPGEGAEMTPAMARAIAGALIRAAGDCEALHRQTRRYGAARREYPLNAASTSAKAS